MSSPLRIREASAQVSTVLVGVIAIVLCGLALAQVSFGLGYLVATTLSAVLVGLCARTFRGASEADRPREWWRMTATPGAGYVLAALFFAQSVSSTVAAVSGRAPAIAWIGVAVGSLIAVGYLHSAVRLSASRGPRSYSDEPRAL